MQLNVRQRDPTQPPTPCFHEIKVNQDAHADTTTAISFDPTGPVYGQSFQICAGCNGDG